MAEQTKQEKRAAKAAAVPDPTVAGVLWAGLFVVAVIFALVALAVAGNGEAAAACAWLVGGARMRIHEYRNPVASVTDLRTGETVRERIQRVRVAVRESLGSHVVAVGSRRRGESVLVVRERDRLDAIRAALYGVSRTALPPTEWEG